MSTNSVTTASRTNNGQSIRHGTSESLSEFALEKAHIKAVQQKYEDLIRRIGPASTVVINRAIVQVQKSNQLVRKDTVEALASPSIPHDETT